MGLDTSHGCWHGAYSAFMRWRQELAKAAGLPPLMLMEGFHSERMPAVYLDPGASELSRDSLERLNKSLPILWECLKPDPLHILLYHSDNDGTIEAKDCGPIADSLERLLPNLAGDHGGHIGDIRAKTQAFIDGLRRAAAAGEDVDFH